MKKSLLASVSLGALALATGAQAADIAARPLDRVAGDQGLPDGGRRSAGRDGRGAHGGRPHRRDALSDKHTRVCTLLGCSRQRVGFDAGGFVAF